MRCACACACVMWVFLGGIYVGMYVVSVAVDNIYKQMLTASKEVEHEGGRNRQANVEKQAVLRCYFSETTLIEGGYYSSSDRESPSGVRQEIE